MLEIARQKFGAGEKVEFQPADATALPFDDGTFDTLVCQFGVMFFPDKDKSYREANRVLTSGGRYYFNVWDSFEFNPFARISHETIGRFFERMRRPSTRFPSAITGSMRSRRRWSQPGSKTSRCTCSRSTRRFQRRGSLRRVDLRQSDHRGDLRAGAADPDAIVAAMTAALQRAFGRDPGRMPLQAIVFSARKR